MTKTVEQINSRLDVAGIGIGPFNLSVAALLTGVNNINAAFYDQKNSFKWYPGLLFDFAKMQTSHLKDLVTLADPTNPYSFLSYLSKNGRLFQFITANFEYIFREEFIDYLQWAAASIDTLHFSTPIREVSFDDGWFEIRSDNNRASYARNLILGSGRKEFIPDFAKSHICDTVFHGINFGYQSLNFTNKRVVIIGGGQTGAEIALHLLTKRKAERPANVTWLSRRSNFFPLDDSPFVNDYFTPSYVRYFHDLPIETRASLLEEQKLSSDGVSMNTLEDLYRTCYHIQFMEKNPKLFTFLPDREVVDMQHSGGHWSLNSLDKRFNIAEQLNADYVILCTGLCSSVPEYLSPIEPLIRMENNNIVINNDYSINWDGPSKNNMYVQNFSRHYHGINDSNLSLASWRSAVIINAIAGHKVFNVDDAAPFIDWVTPDYQTEEATL